MPELPEVETVKRGLLPHLQGRRIARVKVFDSRLRRPIDANFARQLRGRMVADISRRGKYLLFNLDGAHLIIHLGMSGTLCLRDSNSVRRRHDHWEMLLDDGGVLRFNDPRRFGLALIADEFPLSHPLLAGLGPEPLSDEFNGGYFFQRTRGRIAAVKNILMNSQIVAGVGNIYASESLHRAGIRPTVAAGKLSAARCEKLSRSVKAILRSAIKAGGSTLRDFVGGDGAPGYFQMRWRVYGRADESCRRCGSAIKRIFQSRRATYFCPQCQR